ncbi:protein ROOT PRIMORDIUM DEFECTIVE 1-like [Macadamia integrifolia]|uniref:protein ROOT PRIMORDIUM DEFECTIVE 1-like n=1 Tax=Macadamia integrifolia TaxID=60698 RepID=UPI001C4FC32A|nr:protein ROOT PRIMORDIUM DEFECTIVE 1-like [Macadamia integrifolia]
MATQILLRVKLALKLPKCSSIAIRSKTTSSQYVASRARDPTFEKFMADYKNFLKVVSVQDLILANPKNPTLPLDFLDRLSQKFHLNRGALHFIRKYPHIFTLFYDTSESKPFFKLTEAAIEISRQEAAAIDGSKPVVIDRLVRLLSMSISKSLPLRAIFKVWRELGLPDDFEDSIISHNPTLFSLCDAHEPKTHILELVTGNLNPGFSAAVENWRISESCKEDAGVDTSEIRFAFKHGFPPGMRLSKDLKAKVKDWQRLPYLGPYEEMGVKRKSKAGMKGLEKRAVAVVHEFLSLTVGKMVEVEKISHFRNWFGIDLNIRDLFLDHPGIFYLSTKGKRHTIFLREAYEQGRLIDPNPVYDVRRKLFDLVILGRRGLHMGDCQQRGNLMRKGI